MGVIDLSAYKPVPATLGDANQVANGFQAIQALLNGNIDNNNFGAGKIFDPLKLMQDGAVAGQGLVWSAAANGGTGGWVPGSTSGEIAYAEVTSNLTVTSTNENAPQVCVTLPSATYDGSKVYLEFGTPLIANGVAGGSITLSVWDDTAGVMLSRASIAVVSGATGDWPAMFRHVMTPAAGARVFSVRAFVSGGSGAVFGGAGSGGAGIYSKMWARTTK